MISALIPNSANAVKWLGAAVLAVALMVAGNYVGDSFEPDRKPAPPDTIERTRTITRTDTVTETVPRTVIRYDTVQVTDTLQVPVPADFKMQGVIPPKPLDIESDQATLTYWTGDRWQQLVYDLPTEPWGLWPELEARAVAGGLQASAQAVLRYRGLTVTAGYAASKHGRGWTAGVRWRPFTFRW